MKQSIWKKTLAALLLAAMVLTLAACGSSNKDSAAQSSGSASAGTAEKAKYVVATEPGFPPFEITNDKDEVVGFDIDLIKAIGEDQGFEVEVSNLEFDSLIPALNSNNADIVIAGMTILPERAEVVDFSDPYYDSGLVVLVQEGNTDIKGEDSLTADMKVGAQLGTTGADEATKLKDEGKIKEAVLLEKNDLLVQQLKAGDINAIIIDGPVAQEFVNKNEGQFKIVGEVIDAAPFGIAVKKGNSELLGKINTGLKNLVESGKFQEICDAWNVNNRFAKN